MELGIDVSVPSLVEPRIPNECLHRFTSRFFLNLRSIVYHQQTSIFESQGPFSVPAAIRTRRLRERLDQLATTDFADLHMGETVYINETNPIERDIKATETIVLDVIVSQAHQERR